MNVQMIKSWLRHQYKAKTRHGLHSPFVYRLVDEVIYDKKPYADYKTVEEQRKKLLNDTDTISVTDLGAGSQYNNNKEKKVSAIAANALKSPKLAQLIYRLARHFSPTNIIELGTCLGITTSYLSLACPNAKVLTIEGCPNTAKRARQVFEELQLRAIDSRIGNFDERFPQILAELEKVDMLYVDGNHRKQATLDYFEWALPKIHEKSWIIFDDIHWSQGMNEAWEQIKAHPSVSVSIDLFHIGLVFFPKNQEKEHFRVKV